MLLTTVHAEHTLCPLKPANHPIRSACCDGSLCALWRWDSPMKQRHCPATNQDAETETDAGFKPPHCEGWEFCPAGDDSACWVEPDEEAAARREGYCGMGSKPTC